MKRDRRQSGDARRTLIREIASINVIRLPHRPHGELATESNFLIIGIEFPYNFPVAVQSHEHLQNRFG